MDTDTDHGPASFRADARGPRVTSSRNNGAQVALQVLCLCAGFAVSLLPEWYAGWCISKCARVKSGGYENNHGNGSMKSGVL